MLAAIKVMMMIMMISLTFVSASFLRRVGVEGADSRPTTEETSSPVWVRFFGMAGPDPRGVEAPDCGRWR